MATPKTPRPPPFSQRMPAQLQPSPLHAAMQAQAALDLMQSNPQQLHLTAPTCVLPLCEAGLLWPAQHSCGLLSARRALSTALAGLGHAFAPEHLLLTASTSEAYSYVFKLLCPPGAKVALPRPAYPLLQHLVELEGLRPLFYDLHFAGRWGLDGASLAAALQAGATAVVLINPHNPCGMALRSDDVAELLALVRPYGATLVLDEVFAPYTSAPRPDLPAARQLGAALPLVVSLGGLSKFAGLPQLKLAWLGLYGHTARVAAAQAALSFIADAYLSVGLPVQLALPQLLAQAADFQAQVQARLRQNRAALLQALGPLPEVDVLPSEGGWYAVVRMPQHVDEEVAVRALLGRAGVRLHPGFFYDMPRRGTLITGLLQPPQCFAAAWQRCVPVLAALVHSDQDACMC